MYCEIHDVFWDYRDSWFCPLCMLEYSKKLEDMLNSKEDKYEKEK